MFALQTLSATAQWIVYLVAILLFLVSAFAGERAGKVNLMGLGLAVFAFPFFWNNLAAS